MKSSLSIISFMDDAVGVVSKKSSQTQGHLDFLLCYLHISCEIRSFIVLLYIYIYHPFELIFVKGSVSRFILLHMDTQLFQHHLLKRLYLFHCIVFAPLSRISWLYIVWVYFWAQYSVLLTYLPVLSPIPHCLEYCSFRVSLEVG